MATYMRVPAAAWLAIMVVGIVRLSLYLPENRSLKGKRKVVKSICEKVRHRFNVSVAEVESQDLWQASEVGIAALGNEGGYVNSKLNKIINFVDDMCLAEIVNVELELIHL
ncbi:MAG: DUF503 domain-containing protein [Deltaproteobacteria bacterium]|nr:DUF503 domain-containing protein [Deltaproteobacteria bacterium]